MKTMPKIINLAELWRPENMKIQHKVPLGSIVEVDIDMDNGWGPYQIVKREGFGEYGEVIIGITGKLRMFVVSHDRDCDGTPLYTIAAKPIAPPINCVERIKYEGLVQFCFDGVSEEAIKIVPVEPEPVEIWSDWIARFTQLFYRV